MVVLSSGESDFYGILKVATMELGTKGLLTELGVEAKAQVNMDPSAARSIASRRGVGRVRHNRGPGVVGTGPGSERTAFGHEGDG